MKKISFLVLTLFAGVLLASGKIASAAETTLKPYVPYSEDFERFEEDTDGDTVFNDAGLFWFSEHVIGTVVDVDGDKQMKYSIIGDDGHGYSPFGGIGSSTINNLEKLINGKKYHFSMYINADDVTPGSTLWVEYQRFLSNVRC